MRKLILGGVYKHFKNHLVKVLCEALDSETQEEVVVYVHLETGDIWVRPKTMFLDTVTRDGKTFERFTEV